MIENVLAKQIMSTKTVAIDENATVEELIALLKDREISGVPVINQKGQPIGVVSMRDVVDNLTSTQDIDQEKPNDTTPSHFYCEEQIKIRSYEFAKFQKEIDGKQQVQNIMTPIVIHISEDTTLVQMARIMVNAGIHRLMVTQDERLTGIITTLDILKVIANSQE